MEIRARRKPGSLLCEVPRNILESAESRLAAGFIWGAAILEGIGPRAKDHHEGYTLMGLRSDMMALS